MLRCSTFVAAIALTQAATAQTAINAPSLFERSQAQILSDALGTSFVQNGNDLVGGDFQALRVSDSQDQIWQAGTYNVSILARESLFNKKFGYVGGDGDFERILRTTSGPDSATVTIGEEFAWAVKNAALLGGNVYSSINDDNHDGEDHMVTYRLFEGEADLGFVLFFEDWGGHLSDHDFNDLAVFVSLVPAPQAAMLGALGLGGLAFGASRRR
jgi:hypothetical protein